jgi:hypothetical protein
VARSELHESSELCGGCHEYANENGLLVLSTYTEWKESPQAAEGKTCQHCHMPMMPGETVEPSFRVRRGGINLHNISGGHSREQVRKAATVKIIGVNRKGPELAEVEVVVANVGSGHCIPTGMPTRKLTLEVLLFLEERRIHRFERRYERVLMDEQGQIIVQDHRAMLEAKTVHQDSRLRPGERRVEKFVAAVPPKGALQARAKLTYVYEPEIFSRVKMSIEMASDRSQ